MLESPVNFTDFTETKGSPKLDAIKAWLEAHPDQAELSSRQIAELIGGVSHALVTKAKREKGSSDGASEKESL